MNAVNKKSNKEEIIIKAKFSFKRNIPLIIGIVAMVSTFIYSYLWSSQRHENPWEGLTLGYFQSFYIGTAIFCLMLTFYLLFGRSKATITKDKIYGRFSLLGNISIPVAAISSVDGTASSVTVWIKGQNYSLNFVENAAEVKEKIEKLIAEKNPDESVYWEKPTYSYAKKVLVFLLIAVLLVFYVCSSEGLFHSSKPSKSSKSSKSWSELSDREKDNARWAYYAKQAAEEYRKNN